MTNIQRFAAAAAILLSAFTVSHGHSQDYPTRPLTLVVPNPPGALIDTLARALAVPLAKALGQPVIVDNRSGADSLIATQYVMGQPADGYRLLFGVSPISISPLLNSAVDFDFFKKFTPVAGTFSAHFYLFTSNQIPAQNLREFIAYAKANPSKLNYGSGSLTSALSMEYLNKSAGLDLQRIAYRGASPVFQALTTNEVQAAFATIGGPLPFVQAGKFKVIASAAAERDPNYSTIQTMTEAGVPADLSLYAAVFVRTETPASIVQRLNEEINKVMATEEYRKVVATGGANPVILPRDTLAEVVRKDFDAWQDVTKFTNFTQN